MIDEYLSLFLFNSSNFDLYSSINLNFIILFAVIIILKILLKKLVFDKTSKNGDSKSIFLLFSYNEYSLLSKLL